MKVDESMKKADIIKIARLAIQENKKLKKEATVELAGDLPYQGVSIIKTSKGFLKIDLAFSLDTKNAIITGIEEDVDRPEMAAANALKKLQELMHTQQKVEGDSNE